MRIALLALLAACGFHPSHGAPPGDDAPVIDAPVADAPRDAAAPVDARICPDPPSGCATFQCAGSSSCYYICGTGPGGAGRRMWAGARDGCVSRGLGCLATIETDAENACIAMNITPVFPDVVWFGWVQDASGAEPAGGWGWQCGTSTYTASNWALPVAGSEPNNGGGSEDCGAMAQGGAWIDGGCTSNLRYLCELP